MFHFENIAIWTSEFTQCVTPKNECCLVAKKALLLIFSSLIISSIKGYARARMLALEWKERALALKHFSSFLFKKLRSFYWFIDFIIIFFKIWTKVILLGFFIFLLLLNHTWYDWFGHFSYCEYSELFL